MRFIVDSIKGRLFLWFFLCTSALLIILGSTLYQKFRVAIFNSVDNTLHSKLQILKGLLHEEHDEIEFELDEIVLGEYSIPRSGHYYKIIMNGQVEAASESLVDDNFDLTSGRLESYDEQLRERIYISTGPGDEPIRVVQHDFEFLGIPTTVFVAESLDESLTMLNSIKLFIFMVTPLSILTVGIIGLLIARQSLKPLKLFSSKIERITHKTLNERIRPESQVEEIKNIAESFNSMLDRLQHAFETEKRLIADASHEIKTPLSVIKTQCDVLLQKDRTKDEYTEALKTITAASGTMKKQIDDMLTLARLDSGMLKYSDFKTISLENCLIKAVKLLHVLAEKRQIKINASFAGDTNILGNENTLTEAFLNIMENAIRYNNNGGIVDISVSKESNHAKIIIQDNGMGIEEKDLDKIFNRFYRSDTLRGSDGTGLGLSISKAIIEAHNGEINVESKVNKGSCFVVILPHSLTEQ